MSILQKQRRPFDEIMQRRQVRDSLLKSEFELQFSPYLAISIGDTSTAEALPDHLLEM
jgi:hypothetical protein